MENLTKRNRLEIVLKEGTALFNLYFPATNGLYCKGIDLVERSPYDRMRRDAWKLLGRLSADSTDWSFLEIGSEAARRIGFRPGVGVVTMGMGLFRVLAASLLPDHLKRFPVYVCTVTGQLVAVLLPETGEVFRVRMMPKGRRGEFQMAFDQTKKTG